MHAQYYETFQQRLGMERRQTLVGREAEMQALDALLDAATMQRIWFVTGPAGVGKTTLLQAFCEYTRQQDHPFVFVDARNVRPNPPAVRHALEQAAGNQSLSAFCDSHAAPVVLIDTFEQWLSVEFWLRETFFANLPSNLRIIIAARNEPEPDWRGDVGWRSVMRITRLRDLDAREAAMYLARRGVDEMSRQNLIELSGGRPLVLALGADMAADQGAVRDHDDTRVIIERLVTRFTDVADCSAQREALDAAAVVREIDEQMLASILDIEDAGTLFEWLSGLSFMKHGPRGLHPHDLVRRILLQDMPGRFPGRYRAFAQRAFVRIVDEMELAGSLSWTQAARYAADGLYTLRELEVVQHFLYAQGARALYVERASEQDWPDLADMVARHEGLESRAWFEFWCRRAPEAVFVVRDPAAAARGMFLKLDMETLDADDRAADPLTDCLWQHAKADFALPDKAHVPFIRFWTTRDHGQSQSAAKTVILSAINSYNLKADNPRLTAQVFSDSPDWVMQARALGIQLLQDEPVTVGDYNWHIYYNDWRLEKPTRYYRGFAERCINFEAVVAGTRMEDANAAWKIVPDKEAFADAVLAALKAYHSDATLKDNPLLGCALVCNAAERGDDDIGRIRILRECLQRAVMDRQGTRTLDPQQSLTLEQTYLKGELTQKQAAAALGMQYSTFRRQLSEARRSLTDILWQYEWQQRRHA